MDVPDDDTMITLIVKTPNLDVKDQQYECNKNWTVKSLKVYLSDAYPTEPAVEDQRLIYFGHLLSDNLLLREVLNVNNGKIHTIHLVCPPSQNNTIMAENSTKHQKQGNAESIENNVPQETFITGTSHSAEPNFYPRDSNSRSNFPTFQMPSLYPNYVDNATAFAQSAALMQQMYMQYMAQCFHYAQSTGMQVDATANQSVIMPHTPPVTSQNAPEVQVRTNTVENIQNRPAQNAAEAPVANRDLLDKLYILSRITVLLSLLYFYSSLGRCLFVIGLLCIIYLYRSGLFTIRRERQREEARQHLPQPRRHILRHESVASRNRSRTTHRASANVTEARHRRNGQVTAVKTFVTSFFSSLIPDQNNPVAVN